MISIKKLRAILHRFQSTEQLLKQLQTGSNGTALAVLEVLKERLAHRDGTLHDADLSGASLKQATLATAELEAINFSKATLEHIYLHNAQLNRAVFTQANLRYANLRGASIQNACFDHALLQQANFARADLRGSSFQQADLQQANFWETTLIGVDFSGAILTNASLADVICDASTILPDGTAWSVACDWSQYTNV
ncbi:MAG: pentapeptide repeat-containing protein [Anaerolineae bacterium]